MECRSSFCRSGGWAAQERIARQNSDGTRILVLPARQLEEILEMLVTFDTRPATDSLHQNGLGKLKQPLSGAASIVARNPHQALRRSVGHLGGLFRRETLHLRRNIHGTELGTAHGAEVRVLEAVLGQRD